MNAEVSTAELAQVFGVGERRIRLLVNRGIIRRTSRNRFDFKEAVRSYAKHLRGVAAARGDAVVIQHLTVERARLAREQADNHALKNEALRNSLLDAAAVAKEWKNIEARVRVRLMATPTSIGHRLPHLTPHDLATIAEEIRLVIGGRD